ncbi:MAG: hypothetical protein KatS3mg082_0866 [Nitrospiraceae bacterium]|nr:MAG: hypothetical protein KatS3mg082_0866 [Nitrospiraceae bacterium]
MTRFLSQLFAGMIGVILLAGCQGVIPGAKPAYVDNGRFMDLWQGYTRCKSGTDVEAMRDEAEQLIRTAQALNVRSGFVLPLPGRVERLVSDPSPRLAVDVKAMAAACALYAGNLALSVGKNDIAFDMFYHVIKNHTQPEYTYYVSQAKAGMAAVDLGLQASLRRP